MKLADGWYDFVIPQDRHNVIYLAHSKKHWEETANGMKFYNIGNNRGHSSIGPHETREFVCFAGELVFKEGVLTSWTDKSGHYRCTQYVKSPAKEQIVERQTSLALKLNGDRLLPMDRFQAWNGRL